MVKYCCSYYTDQTDKESKCYLFLLQIGLQIVYKCVPIIDIVVYRVFFSYYGCILNLLGQFT
jgi:hypothetical protein